MSWLAMALRKVAEISDWGLLGAIVTEPALHRLADWWESRGEDDV